MNIKALKKERERIETKIEDKYPAWKALDDEMKSLQCDHSTIEMQINRVGEKGNG